VFLGGASLAAITATSLDLETCAFGEEAGADLTAQVFPGAILTAVYLPRIRLQSHPSPADNAGARCKGVFFHTMSIVDARKDFLKKNRISVDVILLVCYVHSRR
jgi:hypothetical protein